MELGLEEASGDERGLDLGRESDGSTGMELGDDAVAITPRFALSLGSWPMGAPVSNWGPSLAVTLPVRPATPMRGKCATESDANAAKVQEASKEHARWGSTGHLRLHSATSVRRKFL
jgi:hypothetical protein